jgi:hypothetical protein
MGAIGAAVAQAQDVFNVNVFGVMRTAGSLAGRASTLRRLAPAPAFDKQIRKLNQLAG